MTQAAAEYVDPSTLNPWELNPRRNDAAVEAIVNSIKAFGFTAPIVARRSDNRILAGHTRWKAAQQMGLTEVPVRFVELDDEQAAALTVADNRLGELAVWDESQLASIVQELNEGSFDLSVLGFQDDEIDALLGQWEDPFADVGAADPDEVEIEDNGTTKVVITVPVTRGHDASSAAHDAMKGIGLTDNEYHIRVV